MLCAGFTRKDDTGQKGSSRKDAGRNFQRLTEEKGGRSVRAMTPPFRKGGPGGILSDSPGKIPLSPPLEKGEAD